MGANYWHSLHSSLLIEDGGQKLVIDVGDGLVGKVKGVLPDCILITHAHPDHAGGLKELDLTRPVYAPVEVWKAGLIVHEFLLQKSLASYGEVKVGSFRVMAIPPREAFEASDIWVQGEGWQGAGRLFSRLFGDFTKGPEDDRGF